MSVISGNPYSSPKNINLRDGILRFDTSKTSNPLTNDSTGWGLYVNSSNELIYWNKTSITTLGAAGGGGGSLDASYSDGHTITVDDGAVVFNDATGGAANILEFNKTATGSGNILDFDFSAAFTGNVLNLDMGSAVAAVGIVIDSEAGARTGVDLLFTDDSTGAGHIAIQVNKSGAGTTGVGFDYNNSYAGSPGGNAIQLTFDANDGLDTGGILITRGAGVRTDNAIAIADNSTGNVSIIDVNVTGVYTGHVLDINFSAAATGSGILITTGSNLAGNAIQIVTANERTAPVVLITSAGTDGGTDDHIFDINVSGLLNSNVLDIVYSVAASDGNAIYIDMATNLAGGALNIAATGTRTDSLIDITTGDGGSVDGSVMFVDNTAVHTGSLVTLTTSAAATTGSLLHLNLDAGVAYKAITFDHAGARTVATILATFDGTFGATGGGTFLDANISMTGALASPFIDIDVSGVYTGNIVDIALGAASTGDVIAVDMNLGVAARFLFLDAGGGVRTANLITVTYDSTGNLDLAEINDSNTGTGHLFDINTSGIGSGNIIDITYSAADTGDALSVVMADNVAGGALVITGAGTRTDSLIDIVTTEAGSIDGVVLISQTTNIFTGHLLTVSATGANTTGGLVHLSTGTSNIAGKVMTVDTAGARTGELFLFTLDHTFASGAGGTLFNIDISTLTGAAASPLIDIDITGGVHTGNIFDFATDQASTGTIFEINMTSAVAAKLQNFTLAGTRTVDAITITDSSAGAVDVFQVTSTSTSSGHIFNIDIDSVFTGNVFDVTFGTSAATGEALMITMGTNVAGRAVAISSAGTGVSGEGSAIDVTHTGALVAGADVVTLQATGVLSSTSNILALESSGAAVSGSFALYIDVANDMEAIKVDTGTVTFDESLSVGTTLAVTGATTLSSTLSYRNLSELVTATNVITAAESGTVFFLDVVGGFTSTLPAPAAGLNFSFIVKTAPTTAYIIATNGGANVLYGKVVERAGGAGVAGAAQDTVNFVASQAIIGDRYDFVCDGTNWHMKGIVDVSAACTFAVT